MAYIVRLVYNSGEEELVPIWSSVLNKEIDILMEDNPSLALYEILSDEPSEDECKYIYNEMIITKYRLPLHFRKNRRRRV